MLCICLAISNERFLLWDLQGLLHREPQRSDHCRPHLLVSSGSHTCNLPAVTRNRLKPASSLVTSICRSLPRLQSSGPSLNKSESHKKTYSVSPLSDGQFVLPSKLTASRSTACFTLASIVMT